MDDASRASAISVVIADKDVPFAQALALFLERDAGFSVVGLGSDTDDAMLKVGVYRPDVVLVDVDNVARDLTLVAKLRQESSAMVIIALAAINDRARRTAVVAAGADDMMAIDRILTEAPALIRLLVTPARRAR